jgi:hypothetical protein
MPPRGAPLVGVRLDQARIACVMRLDQALPRGARAWTKLVEARALTCQVMAPDLSGRAQQVCAL